MYLPFCDVMHTYPLCHRHCHIIFYFKTVCNRIGGILVTMLALSALEQGQELWSGQTKYHEIGICCLYSEHTVIRSKNK